MSHKLFIFHYLHPCNAPPPPSPHIWRCAMMMKKWLYCQKAIKKMTIKWRGEKSYKKYLFIITIVFVITISKFGEIMTSGGRFVTDISRRIEHIKGVLHKMKIILCNFILIEVKKRVHQCDVKPVLWYGSGSWSVNRFRKWNYEKETNIVKLHFCEDTWSGFKYIMICHSHSQL